MKYYKRHNFRAFPNQPATATYYRVSEDGMRIDIAEIDRDGNILHMEKKQFLAQGEFNFAYAKLKRQRLLKAVPEETEPIFAECDRRRNGGISVG